MRVEIEALRSIEREKGIDFETVVSSLEGALASAYKRQGGQAEEARVVIDRATGAVSVFAQELDDDGNVVDEWEDVPRDFGRIVAQTAKQVLMQRLREAEREMTYGEYSGKEGDLVSGSVQIHDRNLIVLDLGNAEAILPVSEQVSAERYVHGMHLRAYITEVRRSIKGVQIVCSRSHPKLVEELFALEVPEITDGIVEIKGTAREAGYRTKIAVASHDPSVDAVGSCVGTRGSRVLQIVEDLGGEKVDIIPWSEEPAEFVANALSPAKVSEVYLYDDEAPPAAVVIVPDYQLSLAIGREGQNARLAARLTGWRIDIKSETQFAEEQAAFQAAYERGEVDEFGTPLSSDVVPPQPRGYEVTPDTTDPERADA
ncbi:transcription termination/antitermination protein NusA [Egibacter rhizosphaerae]|uniref:Transcription termination/antitermination protein NusA n=1 Tax=Egibacter rhizosphaerae TaxID=1670831 RepID=A0A411YCN1_9ACTN|nr:transcription termination factor NusA [Egibacter rhizosphaerae]QBI18948.1 transcription termination/antitermination protein NusA [Egibacter rhizosphaerae]